MLLLSCSNTLKNPKVIIALNYWRKGWLTFSWRYSLHLTLLSKLNFSKLLFGGAVVWRSILFQLSDKQSYSQMQIGWEDPRVSRARPSAHDSAQPSWMKENVLTINTHFMMSSMTAWEKSTFKKCTYVVKASWARTVQRKQTNLKTARRMKVLPDQPIKNFRAFKLVNRRLGTT